MISIRFASPVFCLLNRFGFCHCSQLVWEFPQPCQQSAFRSLTDCKPISIEKTAAKKHIFTHIEWQMFGVYLTCAAMPEMFVWKTAAELQAELTLPTAFRQFLQEELQ